MSVKLAVLKSGENIISNIKEGIFDEKVVCYILEKPCSVVVNGSYKVLDDEDEDGNKISISLYPWPSLSKQDVVELIPDWVVTIVEPNDVLKKMYKTQVLGIENNEIDKVDSSDDQSDSDLAD